MKNTSRNKFKWLEVDRKSFTGKFLHYPEMEEIPENINVQLIVELYSK
jgi:small subunit ribosomal protein S4